MTPFTQSREQLRAELRWLDLQLHRQIRRFRAGRLTPVDEFRGLCVSDPQVDTLLQAAAKPGEQLPPDIDELGAECERLRAENAGRAGAELLLQRLARSFGLDEFERSVLLLAAAPELDLPYEVLCSYLNNDVTRKRPTVDLALRLFGGGDEDPWEKRRHFAPDAPLVRFGLLQWLSENPDIPASSLARAFHLPLPVLHYLLDLHVHEAKVADFTEEVTPGQEWDDLLLPDEFVSRLRGANQLLEESPATVLLFEGRPGEGKRACAEALCGEMGRGLLVLDVEGLMAANTELPEVFTMLGRSRV